MPNHCMNGLINVPNESNADFTVQYNPDVSPTVQTYKESDINSSEKVSELLCDLQRTAMENMPATSTYVPNITKQMMMQGQGGQGG